MKLAVRLVAIFFLNSIALAHHGEAGIEMETIFELDAIVTEDSRRNPRLPSELNFLHADRLAIRSVPFDKESIVFINGRPQPSAKNQFHAGHSIGRWDADTLVVDTANFSFNPSPYQIDVSSGAQQNVIERYRLLEGCRRVAVESVLEVPEFRAEPLRHSRELIYPPDLSRYSFDCVPGSARRFGSH